MGQSTSRLRARVQNGRLILDIPTDLPEGTVFDLVVDDEGDELDESERQALDRAFEHSIRQAKEGQTVTGSELIRDLGRRPRS